MRCSNFGLVRSVRAWSSTLSIYFNHFTLSQFISIISLSCFNYVRRISFELFTLSCFNYVRRISLEKSTLEYKLDYDENLTRASRSNIHRYADGDETERVYFSDRCDDSLQRKKSRFRIVFSS